MIKADGDYLVRYSGNKKCYVATTKWEGVIKHFAIQKLDDVCVHTCMGLYCFTITVLVNFNFKSSQPKFICCILKSIYAY